MLAVLLLSLLALSYLGVRAVRTESDARERLVVETYRNYAGSFAAQLDVRLLAIDRQLASEVAAGGLNHAEIVRRLHEVARARPWLGPLVLVAPDGTLIYPAAGRSHEAALPATPPGDARFRSALAAAEEAEFRLDRPAVAAALYATTARIAKTPEELSLALTGHARSALKAEDPRQSLQAYRKLASLTPVPEPDHVRRGLIARMQLAELYRRMGEAESQAGTLLDAYSFLVDYRFALGRDTYAFYHQRLETTLGSVVWHGQSQRHLDTIRSLSERQDRLAPVIEKFAATISEIARLARRPSGNEPTYMNAAGEPGWVVAFIPVNSLDGERTLAFVTHRWSTQELEGVLTDLQRTSGAGAAAALALVGPGGHTQYASRTPVPPDMVFAHTAPSTLPGWRVSAFPLEGSLGDLAFREARKYAVLLWLILGTAVVGLLLVFGSVSRQIALSRLRSDFVASVSHELKTPLSLIRVFAENLRAGWVSDDKRQQYYEDLTRESERLTSLIDNVLDFSSIEAGTRRYTVSPTDLRQVLAAVLERYRYHLKSANFELVEELPNEPVVASVDREALEQVMINLLSNAVKYARPDERRLRVKLAAELGAVTIIVEDTGIGLSERDRARIFERFYRADHPRVRETAGSGLGLTLAKHTVEAHGGRIDVTSEPGRGTTFYVRLPIHGGTSAVNIVNSDRIASAAKP